MLGVSQGSGFTSRDGCTTKIALQTAQGSPHHPFIALCHYSSYQTHDKAAWCADTHYQEPMGEWQDGGGQRVPQFQQSPGRSRGWWGHRYVPPTHTAAAQPSSPCRLEQPIGPQVSACLLLQDDAASPLHVPHPGDHQGLCIFAPQEGTQVEKRPELP